MPIFDLNQAWEIVLLDIFVILNFFANCLLHNCIKRKRMVKKLQKISRYDSLTESGTSCVQ